MFSIKRTILQIMGIHRPKKAGEKWSYFERRNLNKLLKMINEINDNNTSHNTGSTQSAKPDGVLPDQQK